MSWPSVMLFLRILSYEEHAIHTLAFNEWQYQLHKCTDSNPKSGGKLVLYRQFQFEPVPSGYAGHC